MPKTRDIKGQKFGRLTALRLTDKRINTETIWECKCDCGNIVEIKSSNLIHGKTKSCGCLQKEFAKQLGKTKAKDLIGQRFGRLIVTRITDKRKDGRIIWECKCDCGNVIEANAAYLVSGDKRSCGCLAKEVRLKSAKNNKKDITGQRFGRLVAICATEKRQGSSIIWKCRCDCGKVVEVSMKHLQDGGTRSCGCLLHDTSVAIGKSLDIHKIFGLVENTSISNIKNKKARKDSKTGHRGVYFSNKKGKYIAHIGFQKKNYILGRFDTLEEAIKARSRAEEEIYEPFLKQYEESLKEKKE